MAEDISQWFSVTRVLVVGVISLISFVIWRSYQAMKLFQTLGIPGPRPLPLVGNMLSMYTKGLIKATIDWEAQYGKVFGMVSQHKQFMLHHINRTLHQRAIPNQCFEAHTQSLCASEVQKIFMPTTPTVVVADLDLLREVMVKQFSSYRNRMSEPLLEYKPWADNLLQLTDDHWKHVRSQLSPTFSSGKLKKMLPVIKRVIGNLDQHVKTLAQKGEMVELKKLCSHFAMDSVAGAAFGLDVNSVLDPNDSFSKHGEAILNSNTFVVALLMMFPKLIPIFRRFGLGALDETATQYLTGVLHQALKERRQDTKKHYDFLQLLVDAEKEGEQQGPVDAEIDHSAHLSTSAQWKRKGLNDDEIIANSLIFLLAATDTTSTVMSFTLFMLAGNPEILQKAQAEVDQKLGQDQVSYDTATELTYLEMCINEVTRMYPPGFILDRQAAEDTELGGYPIKKGMRVMIPAAAIHRSPKIWTEPEKFDPERFTAEAKASRHPFSFMPFGLGPRNCIGMRLAQLEMRMALATLLQHYTPVMCEKSVYPPKISPPQLEIKADNGLWVKLTERK